MSLSALKKVLSNKYLILMVFVIIFYSILDSSKINMSTLNGDRSGSAIWFYLSMLYISLPVITFVAFYRLFFVGERPKEPYLADPLPVFEDVFNQDTSLAGGFGGQLLLYEQYLFQHLHRLQDKAKRTERKGVAFASSAAIFPLFTYLLVVSVSLSKEDYYNLSTLTVANLTIATICVSAGVTLINLSKKTGIEVSAVQNEISEIMKMRIVLGSAGDEEIEDIRKKVQLRLIKLDRNEPPKQDENVDVPAIVGILKNISSSGKPV